VIGGDADMRSALLEHLQRGLQHADHRAERAVLPLVEATQPVEMPEQLVGAVYDVDDHAFIMLDRCATTVDHKNRRAFCEPEVPRRRSLR
jgi:hypothetical protein